MPLRMPRFPTIQGYLRFCRVAWRSSRVLTLLVAAATATMIATPLAVIAVVGQVVSRLPAAVRGGPGSADGHALLAFALVAGALVGLQELAGSVREASCDALSDRVNHVLQRDLMREVMRPPGVAHLEDPATTDLISVGRDTFDQWMRPGRLAAELTLLLSARGVLLGVSIVLASFQWWAGPAFLAAVLWAEHEGRQVARKAAETHYGSTQESRRTQYFFTLGTEPPAAKEVRVFGLAGFLLRGFQGSWNRAHAEAFAGSSRRELLAAATLALVCLSVLGWLCALAAQGRLGIGQAVVEAQAILVGLTALGTASASRLRSELALQTIGRYEQAMAAVNREDDSPPLTPRPPRGGVDERQPGTRTLPPRAPLREIRFENVTFRYPGSRTDLLRQLDLVVPAGRSIAVVGDNGVGKTTLVKLLCGLYLPTGGRIVVDGVDLADLDPHRWQRHVAAVFQDNVRYGLSAASNVALGAVEHQDDLAGVRRVAETAGVAGVVERMEQGWDTVLSTQHEGGSDLSGGEWQKLALARALFAVRHGAGVLILDEPAAHLDARSEARLYEQYLELTRGVTTIVVSHRFSTVRKASSIVVIRDGRVSEQGTHDELVRLGGRYAEMFRIQASSFELTADEAGVRP
jgi:ATP-binding cassette subfamily B protein